MIPSRQSIFRPVHLSVAVVATLTCAGASAGTPPSSLTLDTAGFSSAAELDAPGLPYFNDLSDSSRHDFSSAVYPAAEGGYWLIGHSVDASGDPNVAFISRLRDDGSYDTSFGGTGQVSFDALASNAGGLNAATMDIGAERFYFAGAVPNDDDPSVFDLQVTCTNADGSACDGFGSDGSTIFPMPTVTLTQPYGVLVDPAGSLFVVNGCQVFGTGPYSFGDLDVCIVAFDAASGAPIASFGDNGLADVGMNVVEQGWDLLNANSFIVTSAGSPSGHRIYLAGGTQVTPFGGETLYFNAFVLAVSADTGALDTGFGPAHDGKLLAIDDDQAVSYMTDLVELANGRVALVGFSQDQSARTSWLVGEIDASGAFVADFCDATFCFGQPAQFGEQSTPWAIAERPDNGDLVMAGTATTADSTGPIEVVAEMTRGGSAWRSSQALPYSADAGQAQSANVADLLIDPLGRVVVAGDRMWSVASPINEYDATVTRLIDTDTVFATGFDDASPQ